MTRPVRIGFSYRQVSKISDVTDLVAMLFPGNPNQQHAAARILLALKAAPGLTPSLSHLERQHDISRRTLQRVRAKLANVGLIERVTWMNRRYGGESGWKLSGRTGTALRSLAQSLDAWRREPHPHADKEAMLVGLLATSAEKTSPVTDA